ncbi:Nicotinamide/nicotinic acid mononucleotide adenylyltransferase 1 [Orchesella cincta]|uniref:Nicotinamide-nucleotide adenylyltransferase n=1 Tax=Orchesella cincta TaxID=48709 RepID=A0A1D2N185_ORCCI|nr:Nicotinamide/nicotinic acid mononucleotide adenylyltransferase 1 [Orchesella cincta]
MSINTLSIPPPAKAYSFQTCLSNTEKSINNNNQLKLMMSKQRVFLLSTGCFNPPTHMHLRMMELARDHLVKVGCSVIGGALSPVHDSYSQHKQDLVRASSKHRIKMVQLAVSSSEWLKVSSWEAEKNTDWTRTRLVFDHHRKHLDKYATRNIDEEAAEWLPSDSLIPVDNSAEHVLPIRLKLVCGADYLESFNRPGAWENDDALTLARDYGLVVISRAGNDPFWSINNNDILNANRGNIHVVKEWIRNDISSTKVRRSVRRFESVRYIIPDPVLNYIQTERLYVEQTDQVERT